MLAEPLIVGAKTDASLNRELLETAVRRWAKPWRLAFAFAGAGTLFLFTCITYRIEV